MADDRHLTAVTRGPGRPRASPAPPGTDTREQILDAAARLFSTQGYSGTGTREIAAAAGLRPASLFYWFERKEDILAELLDRTVAPALVASDALRARAADPEVVLFALARCDVRNLCGGAHSLGVLQFLPETRAETFAPFWSRRADLRGRYRALLGEIAASGRLAAPNLELATDIVFGTVESVLTWFVRGESIKTDAVADAIAAAAVRAVVSRPSSSRRLRARADRLCSDAGVGPFEGA